MFPHLLGQIAYHHLTQEDVANILGIKRTSFQRKMNTGRFKPEECKKLCEFFGKSFAYLFATEEEVEGATQ